MCMKKAVKRTSFYGIIIPICNYYSIFTLVLNCYNAVIFRCFPVKMAYA